jgi:hypothetical protein
LKIIIKTRVSKVLNANESNDNKDKKN